jgi:Cd2+/Zn2+-exporting ATPase
LESIPESSGRIADGSAGKDGQDASGGGTVVYVACDGTFAGRIVISDVLKEGVPEAIRSLKEEGVSETVMLTGDNASAAKEIARQAGVDKVYAQLLPADKVRIVEQLIKKESGKGALAFAGDGINDAPVLMRSDVGIAMGLIGSDAAIEAADIVLMDDDVRKIAQTVRIARKTMGIIRANITFAIAVKIGILVLSALGVANMWMAIFGDVGVLILCILNAMRLLGHRRKAVPGGVPGAAG